MRKIDWSCHNCDRKVNHDEDALPPGWRWFGLADDLEGAFDNVEALLICKGCVAAVLAALRADRPHGN